MGSNDEYSREERLRPNESELFARVAEDLAQQTKLNALEARGTLSIALKVAGFLTRDVDAKELSLTLSTVLRGELRARGVKDAAEVCEAIELSLNVPRS